MTINANKMKGNWLEIKGELQKAWGKLTDDDLDKNKGDMKAVAGIIQKRYGEVEVKFQEKLDKIFAKYDEKKEETVKSIKKAFKAS
jgi:uncharacterized protein YjbJ (UPF0337 family)